LNLPFVVDASILGNWCFSDERTAEVEDLIYQLASTYAEAPSLLFFELQSLLRKAEIQGRITATESDSFWSRLGEFDIRIQADLSLRDEPLALRDSRQYKLTPYDASYLRLAVEKQLPLATRDKELHNAAVAAGVPLLLPYPA